MSDLPCECPRELVTSLCCDARTLDDGKRVADFIASFCPNPTRQLPGIFELILNAIEHGNLGIGYHAKTALLDRGTWLEEIERRLALPEIAKRRVRVLFERTRTEVKITIRDEGQGFDFRSFLRAGPAGATTYHGRGIAIARQLSFDSLDYRGVGAEVIATVRCDAPAQVCPPRAAVTSLQHML